MRRFIGQQVTTCVTTLMCLLAACSTSPAPAETMGSEPAEAGELVFRDDFDRDTLGPHWGPYSGQPGGDPWSLWDPDQVSLRDGHLVLRADQNAGGQWITGGVSNASKAQTYGRWEVRFRADASDEVTVHFLLWPLAEQWPPEIDFFENYGGARDNAEAWVHWIEQGQRAKTSLRLTGVDFTKWQTIGVDWRADRIDFLVNGRVWDTYTGPGIPHEPMWLALQAQAGGCAKAVEAGNPPCPWVGSPQGAEVLIDWVEVRQ